MHSFEVYLQDPSEGNFHASDIAYLLKKVRSTKSKEEFFKLLSRIPSEVLGDVLLELPEKIKDEALEELSTEELARAIEDLESDDATDLVKDIDDLDIDKSEAVVAHLDEEDREDIDKLRQYEEHQAGAWMQTELFDAKLEESVQEAIDRLRDLKEKGELENIYQLFIVDDNQRLLAGISLEDLIVMNFSRSFKDILAEDEYHFLNVEATEDIEDVAKMFEQYDLSVLPVLDWQGKLVGRITADDIYDVMEEKATEQIYNLAGVNDEAEQEEKLFGVFKKRASWLGINLITAILASIVIGMFDETLAAFIPLAILMPIVASMGGNAGTQTLTVMVRQMALGDIDTENAKEAIKKEFLVALFNGMLFSVIIGIIAYLWFKIELLGVVIALAMIFNLLVAGVFGAFIPLFLKRLDVDPAVGSTVLLTTVTDVLGFLSFLGLASIIL
ncbi:magnesium transporter [Sulfurimonas sp. MAG313]|nr:magnesium transporter [Sulfurimonas sp. MAG313]